MGKDKDDKDAIEVTTVDALIASVNGQLKKDIAGDADLASAFPDEEKRKVEAGKIRDAVITALKTALGKAYEGSGSKFGLEEDQALEIATKIRVAQKTQGRDDWDGKIDVDGSQKMPATYAKSLVIDRATEHFDAAIDKAKTKVASKISDEAVIDKMKTLFEQERDNLNETSANNQSAYVDLVAKYVKAAQDYSKTVGVFAGYHDTGMDTTAKEIAEAMKATVKTRAELTARQKTFDEADVKDPTEKTEIKTAFDALKEAEQKVAQIYKDATQDYKDKDGKENTAPFKNRSGKDKDSNEITGKDKLLEAFKYTLNKEIDGLMDDKDFLTNWKKGGKDGQSNLGTPGSLANKSRIHEYAKLDTSQVSAPSVNRGTSFGGKKEKGSREPGEGMSSETKARIAGVGLILAGAGAGYGLRQDDPATGQKKQNVFSIVMMTALGIAGAALLMKPDLMQLAGQKFGGMGRG
jgi:hypothetical protein